MAYRSVNPATGEVLKNFTEHTDGQMWNAMATADKAISKLVGTAIQPALEDY